MLPKSKRLSTETFKKIIEKGQSFYGPFLIVRVYKTAEQSHFGISVPKKVSKLATSRNKIKRRIYSIIGKLDIKSGFSVIVIAKTGFEKLTFLQTKDEIEKIFVKSSLLK